MRLIVLVPAALVLAGAASAQQTLQLRSQRTPEQREAAFKTADANKDGKLDLVVGDLAFAFVLVAAGWV